MTQTKQKNRRRNYLSQPRTQLRIIVFFVVLALVYALLNVYISKYAFHRLGQSVLALDLSSQNLRDVGVLIDQHRATLDLQLFLFTGLSLVMLVLASLLLSHRIGGPIFHIKRYLDELAAGTAKPRQVQLRKDDFFHDLAEVFNKFQEAHGLLDSPAGKSRLHKRDDARSDS